jgi:hypothetical protein
VTLAGQQLRGVLKSTDSICRTNIRRLTATQPLPILGTDVPRIFLTGYAEEL